MRNFKNFAKKIDDLSKKLEEIVKEYEAKQNSQKEGNTRPMGKAGKSSNKR